MENFIRHRPSRGSCTAWYRTVSGALSYNMDWYTCVLYALYNNLY